MFSICVGFWFATKRHSVDATCVLVRQTKGSVRELVAGTGSTIRTLPADFSSSFNDRCGLGLDQPSLLVGTGRRRWVAVLVGRRCRAGGQCSRSSIAMTRSGLSSGITRSYRSFFIALQLFDLLLLTGNAAAFPEIEVRCQGQFGDAAVERVRSCSWRELREGGEPHPGVAVADDHDVLAATLRDGARTSSACPRQFHSPGLHAVERLSRRCGRHSHRGRASRRWAGDRRRWLWTVVALERSGSRMYGMTTSAADHADARAR